MNSRNALAILFLIILSVGCESQSTGRDDERVTTVTRTTEVHETRTREPNLPAKESVERTAVEARNPDPMTLAQRQLALQQLAHDIASAKTRDAQATALRRLWQHMRDHNYTYQTSATRLSDNRALEDPASVTDPVRMSVSIFQADRRLYDFSFNPIDNRDITFLTRGGT